MSCGSGPEGDFCSRTVQAAFHLEEGWGLPSADEREELLRVLGAVGRPLRSEGA